MQRGYDLLKVVKKIDAKMLFPIYTEYPELYVRAITKITIVVKGVVYKLGSF